MENKKSSRRTFIQQSALAAAGLGLAGKVQAAGWEIRVPMTALTASGSIRPMVNSPPGAWLCQQCLEPHIDEMTMMIHHDKHHAGYVAKLNAAIDKALNFAAAAWTSC